MNSIEETFKILERQLVELGNDKELFSYKENIDKISLLLNKKFIREVDSEFIERNENNIINGDFQSHRYSNADIIEFYNSFTESVSQYSQKLPLPTILGILRIIEFSMIMNTMDSDGEKIE